MMNLFDPSLIVCMDTETTGLGPDAEICQLAIIDYDEKPLMSELIKPYGRIPPEATAIHGITDKMVRDKRPIDYYWPHLMGSLLSGKIVLGYNVTYDVRMLFQSAQQAARRNDLGLNKSLSPLAIIDVMMAFKRHQKLTKWTRLSEACTVCGFDTKDLDVKFHDALYDATITLRIFKYLETLS